MNSEQVDQRMYEIQRTLSSVKDGVYWFNWAYLLSRTNVLAAVKDGYFTSPSYIRTLDVIFAGRWLAAYDASLDDISKVPVCWQPLFRRRSDPDIRPIQFVGAGLKAHILRDLAWTVKNTEAEPDVIRNKLWQQDTHWPDYSKVSDVLSSTMAREVLPAFRDSYDGHLFLGFDVTLGDAALRGWRLDAWDRGNTWRQQESVLILGGEMSAASDVAYNQIAAFEATAFLTPVPVE